MRFLLIFFCFVSSIGYSQNGKFIIERKKDYTEEYYILESDSSKHGDYVRYKKALTGISVIDKGSTEILLMETGSYFHGNKNAQWDYFYDASAFNNKRGNSLRQRAHFVNGKKHGLWTLYYKDTVPNFSVVKKIETQNNTDLINLTVVQPSMQMLQIGRYSHDKRVGEWTSFDEKGKIYQKYDFTRAKLIFDFSINDSTLLNLNRAPIFIGGTPCLDNRLLYNFKLPYPPPRKKHLRLVAIFSIDEYGNMSNIQIIQEAGSSEKFKTNFIAAVESLGNDWLPGLSEGKPVKMEYKILGEIKVDTENNLVGVYFDSNFK